MKTSSSRFKNLALNVNVQQARILSIISIIGMIVSGFIASYSFYLLLTLFTALEADISFYTWYGVFFAASTSGIIVFIYVFNATRNSIKI